jgi:hypothetical protein
MYILHNPIVLKMSFIWKIYLRYWLHNFFKTFLTLDGFWRVESSQTPARGPQFEPNVQSLTLSSTNLSVSIVKNLLHVVYLNFQQCSSKS